MNPTLDPAKAVQVRRTPRRRLRPTPCSNAAPDEQVELTIAKVDAQGSGLAACHRQILETVGIDIEPGLTGTGSAAPRS